MPERLADSVFVEPAQHTSSTFVGRDREMAELKTALDGAIEGQGRLVMLVGEPGIGKTRTAQELAMLAVQRGDQSAAEEHYAYLQGQRGTMITTVTSVDRLLGLLSQTMGNLDQAMSHFEDSLAFCRKAGYRPELAWTWCDYADTLLQRNGEGDRAKGMSLLNESLSISQELGMRPLTERVLSRREMLGT